jgi:hypothetical protein
MIDSCKMPCGRLTYGISTKNSLRFVAVTLEPDDAKIFNFLIYSNRFGPSFHFRCVCCKRMISEKYGTVEHTTPHDPVKPCNANQLEDAHKSVRQWAAFRANEEAKEDGLASGTFTLVDWQRWMKLAGCEPKDLSDEEWSRLHRFVRTLEALPADRLQIFKKRARAGESHVRFINELRSRQKGPIKRKTPEVIVVDNNTELPPVQMATLDSGSYENSYLIAPTLSVITSSR